MRDGDHAVRLPLTHYDRIKAIRPELWNFVNQDIEQLRSMGIAGSVGSVDDYESKTFGDCIEDFAVRFITDMAGRFGMSFEEARDVLAQGTELPLLIQSVTHDFHNVLNFERAGRKTFYFWDNITDHLLATELDVAAELLQPPFDSSLFVFTARSAVEAAFEAVHKEPEPEDLRYPLSVFVVSLPDRKVSGARKILMSITHWRGDHASLLIKREVAIREGWRIEDALRTDWTSLDDAHDGVALSLDGMNRQTSDEEFYKDGSAIFRLILNAVLYLGSTDPDVVERLSGRAVALKRADSIKSRLKAKKARHDARRESELNFRSVGENVHPIYVEKEIGGRGGLAQKGGTFREYAVRFIVRGHWRNQACGPGRMERRLTWIKPYYKGPEMAELVNRPYSVH